MCSMRNDEIIDCKRIEEKRSIFDGHTIEAIVVGVTAVLLCFDFFYFLNSQYLEGRGIVPFGSWGDAVLASYAAGIFFFLVFIVIGIIRHKKYMLLSGILLLFMFPAMFFVAVGVGKPGYVEFAEGFRDRIAARCDAQEMRDWAAEFLKTHPRGKYTLTEEQVPNFIKKVHPKGYFNNHAYVLVQGEGGDDKPNIMFKWGRLGGIVIGSKDLNLKSGKKDYYLKWQDGIYIWQGLE